MKFLRRRLSTPVGLAALAVTLAVGFACARQAQRSSQPSTAFRRMMLANLAQSKSGIYRPGEDRGYLSVEDINRQAAKMVLDRGGKLFVYRTSGYGPLLRVNEERFCLVSVDLSGQTILSRRDWELLGNCKFLLSLDLSQTGCSDEDLTHLAPLRTLQGLFLRSSHVLREGWQHVAQFTALSFLSLSDSQHLTDDTCEKLKQLRNLRHLELARTSITDRGLRELGALQKLYLLQLSDCPGITARGLEFLQPLPSLRWLDLRDTRIADEAEAVLTEFTNLQVLILEGTRISDHTALRIQQSLPQCTVMHRAMRTSGVDRRLAQWAVSKGAEVITVGGDVLNEVPSMPFAIKKLAFSAGQFDSADSSKLVGANGIVSLSFDRLKNADRTTSDFAKSSAVYNFTADHSDISAEGLAHLRALTELERLSLRGCRSVTDDALKQVSEMSLLSWLNLHDTSITNTGVAHLRELRNLTDLRLGGTGITSDGIRPLVALPRLAVLGLTNTKVDNKAVRYLAQLDSLRVVWLDQTQVTAEGVAELADLRPDCFIFHESRSR